MKMNNPLRIFTLVSIAYLSFFFLFGITEGWLNSLLGETNKVLVGVIYCFPLVPLAIVTTGWLIWNYRRYLSNRLVWWTFQLLFVVSMALYTMPILNLFFGSILVLLLLFLGFVNFFHIYFRKASLVFLGWGTLGLMFAFLLIWSRRGNFFEEMVLGLEPNGANNLWWLSVLMCGFGAILFAGMIAFIVETLRIFSIEFFNKEQPELQSSQNISKTELETI